MAKLCCMEYLRNIKNNLVLSLILSIMGIVIVSVMMMYEYEYGKAAPFLEGAKGADYFVMYQGGENFDNIPEIAEQFCVEKAKVGIGGQDADAYVYGEWIYKYWQPRLKEGKWITDNTNSEIGVVIGGITDGYSLGDRISLDSGITCKITGILQNDAEILWRDADGYDMYDHNNYSGFFSAPVVSGEQGIYLILSDKSASMIGLSSTPFGNWCILSLDKSIAKEKKEELESVWGLKNEDSGRITYKSFKMESKKQLNKKIGGLAPLALGSFTLLVMVVGFANYVTVKTGMRVYRIYHLLGAKTRNCALIVYGNTIGIVLVSAFFYYLEEKLLTALARDNNYVMGLQGGHQYATLMYILFLIVPGGLLVALFAGKSPMELVRGERR